MPINQLIYGTGKVQIILQNGSGFTERLTFQSIEADSMKIHQIPEGVLNVAGSPGSRKKLWNSLNFRTRLEVSWDYSLTAAMHPGLSAFTEAWSGTAWVSKTNIENVEALRRLINSAMLYPCIVFPHADGGSAFFNAQPDMKSELPLDDQYGFAHGRHSMALIGQDVGPLIFGGDYFDPGYIDPGYI